MNTKQDASKSAFLPSLIAMLLVSISCSFFAPSVTIRPTETNARTQIDPTNTAESTSTPAPPSPTPSPLGSSRINPYPRTDMVSVPDWSFQILEVKRGEDARAAIQAENMKQEPAPEGSEYLLLRLYVKCISEIGSATFPDANFIITGNSLLGYPAYAWQGISRTLQLGGYDLLTTGDEFETWVSYIIPENENGLILVFDDPIFLDGNDVRYVAIDDEASIGVPSELANIQPNDIGKEQTAPAHLNEKIITEDWELTVLEVVRGADAQEKIQEANAYIPWYPKDAVEAVAMKLRVRYINQADRISLFEPYFLVRLNGVDNFDQFPFFPIPSIKAWFFPGGEREGWIAHSQVPVGETDFDLLFNLYGDERYFSLEP